MWSWNPTPPPTPLWYLPEMLVVRSHTHAPRPTQKLSVVAALKLRTTSHLGETGHSINHDANSANTTDRK